MFWIKTQIVIFLEWFCMILDNHVILYLPGKLQVKWYCKLAEVSDRLDQKWKTGVWK